MLSIVAICKNEAKNIRAFVNSWNAVADEIIVVDTGSTDDSYERLKQEECILGSKVNVRRFSWDGSFSSARNYASSIASGQWIMWADLDDRIDSNSIELIRSITAWPRQDRVYAFQVASDMGEGKWSRFMQVRLFPNMPSMLFEKTVHENLESSIQKMSMQLFSEPEVIIAHLGYADPVERKRKAVRNLEMLLEADPQDAAEFAQVGDSLFALEKYHIGLGYYEEAVRRGGELAKKNLADKLCMGYLSLGLFKKAEDTLLSMSPFSMRYLFWKAELLRLSGDKEGAAVEYARAIEGARGIEGRECNGDVMISEAKRRLAEMEVACSA